MKKHIHKILKFKRTVSFIFAEKIIQEEWTVLGRFKFSTYKAV